MADDLPSAVRDAAARPEVLVAIEAVYADIARAIAERRPVCEMSGRCCKFEEYGHRLYVSTLELAAFYAGAPRASEWDGTGCPFQKGKLCTVHTIRPFGCRMYFCDPTAQDWQQGMYEQFHARLKDLHQELDVPYYYVEWRGALKDLGLVPAS
jgi:Fe-S-cluster containining protein